MRRKKDISIVVLLVIGLLILLGIECVYRPAQERRQQEYETRQRDPLTHDLSSIQQYQSLYMGDAANTIHLFENLPLQDLPVSYENDPDSLTFQIDYNIDLASLSEQTVMRSLIYNSAAAFGLIDNLNGLRYRFLDNEFSVSRADFSQYFEQSFSELVQSPSLWESAVNEPLQDDNIVIALIETYFHKTARQENS